MDDTFGIIKQNEGKIEHLNFLKCLNKVHPALKFTCEIEKNNRISFLDTLIIKEENGSLNTTVYRKPSNTCLTINPKSNQNPNTWIGVLKGALNRAYTFCSKQDLLEQELNYLKMNFQDNDYNKHKIDTIIKNYNPKKRQEKYTDRLRTRNKTNKYKINKNITHVSIPYIKHLNNAIKEAFNRNKAIIHMQDLN